MRGRVEILVVGGLVLLATGCCACGLGVRTSKAGKHSGDAAFTFEKDSLGGVSQWWGIWETNPTEKLATWAVTEDDTAPSGKQVMALTKTANYNGTFNLAVAKGTLFKDLDLTVMVKGVGGSEDQGGGPVWRCTDKDNYYVCRFNPLEGNYRVYRVVDGKRKQLDSVNVATEAGSWYAVRVTMEGHKMACYLDGKKLLEAEDDSISPAGMVGLWTKADAVTSFDDLRVREISAP